MDTSLLLTIIGLIATLVFGFLSIDLFKRKKYPGRITLVQHSIISLFNNISKNFEEISIQYKNEPIKENVVYLKATFINDGDIDIDNNSIEKPITIELKEGLKWIKSKVTEVSSGLSCNSLINDSGTALEFNFKLFRRKEFIQFEALIEIGDPKYKASDVYDNLTINHRIANTHKIQLTSLLNEEQMKKKKGKIKSNTLTYSIYFVVMIVVLFIELFYLKNTELHYITPTNIEFKASPKSDNTIEIKNIKTGEKKSISLTEFQDKENYKPITPPMTVSQKMKESIYILPFFCLILILMIGLDYYELRKANKIYNILNQNKKIQD